MKTTIYIIILPLTIVFSCNSGHKKAVQKVSLGIYETISSENIPGAIIDSLKNLGIWIGHDSLSPVLGYVQKKDSIAPGFNLSSDRINVVRTARDFDTENKYYSFVAINSVPVITLADINKTINKGNSVEIHFNLKGARKWADLTKNNTGHMVAFVINNKIFALPIIQRQIKSGVALINRLPDEMTARKLSDEINASIPE